MNGLAQACRYTPEEVFREFSTSATGLSEGEWKKRLVQFGRNEINKAEGQSLVVKFIRQFTHFLAILLWIAAGLSFLSEFLHPGEGMLALGVAIVGVVLVNACFTFVQEYKAERAVQELKKLLPFRVRVLREGIEREVDAAEIVPGELFLLSEGMKIPADARVMACVELKMNHASLTGESEPMIRTAAPFSGDPSDSPNIVFAGTTVLSGSGRAVAFATGMNTEFGKIAHLTTTVAEEISPLQREIRRVTRIVAILSTLMGSVFFVIGYFIGRSFWQNFLFAIGIIVANVPEGLLPTVTLALAIGSQRMVKRKALMRGLNSVETLGSVNTICTDKTGTLTQSRMTVTTVWANRKMMAIDEAALEGPLRLFEIAAFCNNARIVDGELKGDPTEVALLHAGRKIIGNKTANRLTEIPFDSERKRMSTLNQIDGRNIWLAKGAVETLLPLCVKIRLSDTEIPLTESGRKEVVSAYESMEDLGLRVLAFACGNTGVPDAPEKDLVFAGLIGLEDPPRPEVPLAIQKCKEAGIKVIMVTGDGSKTALAIARKIGLTNENPVVVEASRLAGMDDEELKRILSSPELIFSRMTPRHKMRIVAALKEKGERVAVTGDGVNDAPALRKADIGIAMGITGTDVARESSDMVLLDDNFATIVSAIEEGRAVYENIKKFMTYILSSNVPEIVPYIAYVLFRIPLPLTILQILAVDLGTDMLPALALGAERPTDDIMKKVPRKKEERLLDGPLLRRAYLFLGPLEAIAGLFGFFYVLKLAGWEWGQLLDNTNPVYRQATTACLTGIVLSQVANVFACRSAKHSVFRIGFFSNKLIFAGIAAELLLQLWIVYHPIGNLAFSTLPLAWGVWVALLPFPLILFASAEVQKWISNRKHST